LWALFPDRERMRRPVEGADLLSLAAYVLFLVAQAGLASMAAYAAFQRVTKGWG
jgi:hypothetical protein